MVKKAQAEEIAPDDPRLVTLPLDQLTLDPENVRAHSERNIAEIAKSLKRFGQRKPILVDERNVVIAGNGTVLAARQIGMKHLLCMRSTFKSPEERRAYAIVDNRTTDLSEFDDAKLHEQLSGLAAVDLLGNTGFDDEDLQELAAFLAPSTPGSQKRGLSGFKNVPVVRIVIAVENLEKFEQAMALTGEMNREAALLKLSETYIDAHRSEKR